MIKPPKEREKFVLSPKLSSKSLSTTRLKFNPLGATVFDYISRLNEFETFETANKFFLDEEQLKKLNSIWSNLPFDILKQEYEKKSFDVNIF